MFKKNSICIYTNDIQTAIKALEDANKTPVLSEKAEYFLYFSASLSHVVGVGSIMNYHHLFFSKQHVVKSIF